MMMVRMLTSQKLDLNRCARCALPTDMREILMRGKENDDCQDANKPKIGS